jgi:hypothetical protein
MRRRTEALVTRASLLALLNDPVKRPHVIGRALVVLFNNQTRTEQSANSTQVHNDIGFSGADARDGTITAKYYLKNKTLLDWQVERWMKDFRGFPRICKYHAQLNRAAIARQAVDPQ